MRVGLISYHRGHLKTQQLALRFLAKDYDVSILAFPFKEKIRSEDLRFQDRPDQLIDVDMNSFCAFYGIDYIKMPGWDVESCALIDTLGYEIDYYFTCTAKIVPDYFLRGKTVINAHPGILPQNRGVDAFKWSVVNVWPIGVTLHIIDNEIDRGIILKRFAVPIFIEDTLSDVAARVYEFEIDLPANFSFYIQNRSNKWCVGDDYPISHSKISDEQDANLACMFANNKKCYMQLAARRVIF